MLYKFPWIDRISKTQEKVTSKVMHACMKYHILWKFACIKKNYMTPSHLEKVYDSNTDILLLVLQVHVAFKNLKMVNAKCCSYFVCPGKEDNACALGQLS